MSFLTTLGPFLLGLSIIVGIHELGHMLLAKLCGMRVESYTIGFPPKIFKFKWGETVYGLGMIPLGGSVKIAGMFDETDDTESSHDNTTDFNNRPAWQRMLVILGGILFNVASAILILSAIAFSQGDTYLTKEEVNKQGIMPNTMGTQLGFQMGDQITHINGKDFLKFTDVLDPRHWLTTDSYYTVVRQDQTVHIAIPPNALEQLTNQTQQENFVTPLLPFVVGEVEPQKPADQAGLQKGDQIVELAGQPIAYLQQLQTALANAAETPVCIRYVRDGVAYTTTTQLDATGKLGFYPMILLHTTQQNYTLLTSAWVGTQRAFGVVWYNLLGLAKIVTGQASFSKSLSGPIGIARILGASADWVHFWNIVACLSMILAFTNLLPIPLLDGGHAVCIGYEMIVGKALSDRFLQITQKIGLAILTLITAYAVLNDLYKLLG